MSTTTSAQSSGLLNILLSEFEKETEIKVKIKVIAKGTGADIRDSIDCNVDVIFVHAKSLEDAFIAQVYGTNNSFHPDAQKI